MKPVNVAESFAALEAGRRQAPRDIHIPDMLGSAYVAMTVLIFSFSYLIPVVPILLLYAMWLSLPLFKGFRTLQVTRTVVWISLIPLLCIMSTVWSNYPMKSLYLGLASLSMIPCIIIMNRTVRFTALAEGLVIGVSVAMVITIASGKYGTDYMSGTYSLIGFFGSKNIVGVLAQIGVLASTAVFFTSKHWLRKCILSLGPLLLCLLSLYLSKSATSMASLAVALAAMLWVAAVAHLPVLLKRMAMVGTVVALLIAITAGLSMGGSAMILKILGKDATLTGRTYLWQQGYKIGLEKPLLGHGYSAFWVRGQPQAERYWEEFKIPSRSGFHFHSAYVQSFVDIGLIGVLLIATQILTALWQSLRVSLRAIRPAESALMVGFATMIFVRAFAEIDFFNPFSIGAFIFYSCILRVAALKNEAPYAATQQ